MSLRNSRLLGTQVFMVLISFTTLTSTSRAQNFFGRTVGTGTWLDGNWTFNGLDFGDPGFDFGDRVVIGDATATPKSVEPATVILNTYPPLRVLSIRLGGASASAIGNLQIGSIGNIHAAQAVTVNNGLLEVDGGVLEADSISISGSKARARFNGLIYRGYSGGRVTVENGGSLEIEAGTRMTNMSLRAASGGKIDILQTTRPLNSLEVFDAQSKLSILAETTIADARSIVVGNQGKLQLDASLSTGGRVSVANSFLEQNVGVLNAKELSLQYSSFVRNGGSIVLDALSVRGGPALTIGASDQINSSLFLADGASLSSSEGRILTGSVTLDRASLSLDGNLIADSLTLLNQSSFSQPSNATIEVRSLELSDHVDFHLTGDSFVSESLKLSNVNFLTDKAIVGAGTLTVGGAVNAVFNEAANFSAATLRTSMSVVTFRSEAQIDSLTTWNSPKFVVEQSDGALNGLTLGSWLQLASTGADFAIQFDAASGNEGELDWGLRLAGDQVSTLQQLLDAGRITAQGLGDQSLSVIYDRPNLGDWTHVGYYRVNSVPEPSSGLAFAAFAGMIAMRRCKRKK